MWEVFQFTFFRQALLAALLASVACGVIGTYVVVKRIASISGGLSHAALGGVGIGVFLGIHPMLGAGVFTMLCAWLMGFVYRRRHDSLDTLIAIVWSIGMAVGILFIAMTPGYVPDLTSYLFGNILFVSKEYLILTALLDVLVLVLVFLFYKELQAVSFDEEFSQIVGLRVELLFLLLLSLISLSVVILIRLVGVILTISLLTMPAVIARQWSSRLQRMMLLSVVICAACSVGGLFLSYWLGQHAAVSLPTGPLVILLCVAAYGASSLLTYRR